ncbi:hypothetical protein QUA43_14670 [Microcoleus sp. N9_B4]
MALNRPPRPSKTVIDRMSPAKYSIALFAIAPLLCSRTEQYFRRACRLDVLDACQVMPIAAASSDRPSAKVFLAKHQFKSGIFLRFALDNLHYN